MSGGCPWTCIGGGWTPLVGGHMRHVCIKCCCWVCPGTGYIGSLVSGSWERWLVGWLAGSRLFDAEKCEDWKMQGLDATNRLSAIILNSCMFFQTFGAVWQGTLGRLFSTLTYCSTWVLSVFLTGFFLCIMKVTVCAVMVNWIWMYEGSANNVCICLSQFASVKYMWKYPHDSLTPCILNNQKVVAPEPNLVGAHTNL